MVRIPVGSPWELRLPAEARARMERALVLRVLSGWALLALMALIYA